MCLVNSTSTFVAEVNGQLEATLVHTRMFRGGTFGDLQLILRKK